MARAYDNGSLYSVSLNEREIAEFRRRWPASGLGSLRNLWAQFDKRNGDLVDIQCNRRRGCGRFDGEALSALAQDGQCLAEKRLKLDTGRCADRKDWKEYLGGLPTKRRKNRRKRRK